MEFVVIKRRNVSEDGVAPERPRHPVKPRKT